MKRCLVDTRFPYAIVERVAKNKVTLFLNLASPEYTFLVTVVKNWVGFLNIPDLIEAYQLYVATYMEFSLWITLGTIYRALNAAERRTMIF